jgi:RND family efflux transporter MFP subunit
LDVLRVYTNVPQPNVASIHVGQDAVIVAREFPNRQFKGKVARTANSLDPATRTLLTEVDVPNPDLALLPGMYVQVRFDVTASGIRWRIPASALVFGPQGTQVGIVTAENTVHYQNVVVERDLGSAIEISSGLRGDETLVRTPSAALPEGTRIQVAKQ